MRALGQIICREEIRTGNHPRHCQSLINIGSFSPAGARLECSAVLQRGTLGRTSAARNGFRLFASGPIGVGRRPKSLSSRTRPRRLRTWVRDLLLGFVGQGFNPAATEREEYAPVLERRDTALAPGRSHGCSLDPARNLAEEENIR
jgi:hypothetical protein